MLAVKPSDLTFRQIPFSVRDLVDRLGQNQRSAGKIDELPGLTFLGSVLKIANNLKKRLQVFGYCNFFIH
jgi:hypothetical protein